MQKHNMWLRWEKASSLPYCCTYIIVLRRCGSSFKILRQTNTIMYAELQPLRVRCDHLMRCCVRTGRGRLPRWHCGINVRRSGGRRGVGTCHVAYAHLREDRYLYWCGFRTTGEGGLPGLRHASEKKVKFCPKACGRACVLQQGSAGPEIIACNVSCWSTTMILMMPANTGSIKYSTAIPGICRLHIPPCSTMKSVRDATGCLPDKITAVCAASSW